MAEQLHTYGEAVPLPDPEPGPSGAGPEPTPYEVWLTDDPQATWDDPDLSGPGGRLTAGQAELISENFASPGSLSRAAMDYLTGARPPPPEPEAGI
jgi:hypothetical protein